MNWTAATYPQPGVVTVEIDDFSGEQWFLLRSDAHWDNPDSDWRLQKQHLDEALERKAGIIDFGDLFCAMQGKYDKRSNKDKVRPEHQHGDYLDRLVKTAADWYEPYSKNWTAQYIGNHETGVLKNHETNLLERWVQTLNDRTGSTIPIVGYSGWVRFKFKFHSTKRKTIKLWGIHGYGGGGPVTKDMIQRARMHQYVGNADIICSGHTHDQWATKDIRLHMTPMGYVEQRPVVTVKLPTYKDEYKQGLGGFHIEKGRPPKPLGAYWLRFYLGYYYKNEAKKTNSDKTVLFEIREAVA